MKILLILLDISSKINKIFTHIYGWMELGQGERGDLADSDRPRQGGEGVKMTQHDGYPL